MELPELPDQSVLRTRLKGWTALNHLTPRELDLVVQLHQGFRDKHIARNLGIALATVSTELRALYRKVGVTSRNELVAACLAVLLSGGGEREYDHDAQTAHRTVCTCLTRRDAGLTALFGAQAQASVAHPKSFPRRARTPAISSRRKSTRSSASSTVA